MDTIHPSMATRFFNAQPPSRPHLATRVVGRCRWRGDGDQTPGEAQGALNAPGPGSKVDSGDVQMPPNSTWDISNSGL